MKFQDIKSKSKCQVKNQFKDLKNPLQKYCTVIKLRKFKTKCLEEEVKQWHCKTNYLLKSGKEV